MYYSPENKSKVKSVNLIDEDTKRNPKYILSQNEKENKHKNFKSLNNIIKKSNMQLNRTFKNNNAKIKESINNAINTRQSLYNSNEEKKNDEEKFKYKSKLSDSILDILFDYTGSKNIKINSNIVKYNNKGKIRSNNDLSFGLISYKNDDNILLNENKKLENIMNKKINFNYDIDLERQDNNSKEVISDNSEDNEEENLERDNGNSEDKNIIINYNKKDSFGNKDINYNITNTESAHFNMDTDNIIISQKIEKEMKGENGNDTQIIKLSNNDKGNLINDNKYNESESDNQLNFSKNLNFNYKRDILFGKINMLDSKKPQESKTFIPSLVINDIQIDNKLNQFLKINKKNENEDFDNSYIIKETQSNNYNDTNSNFIESKSSSISIDTLRINKVNEAEKEIETQIKEEEEKLKKLVKEKIKLINEENERKKMIIDEMNKKKMNRIEMKSVYEQVQKQKMIVEDKINNIILEHKKRKEKIKELLRQDKKDEEQLISLNNLNMNDNNNNHIVKKNNINNYNGIDINEENNFDDYSRHIKIKNGVINKNSLEMIKSKFNNGKIPISNSYMDNIIISNKNRNLFNKNEPDYNFKKLEKNNYNHLSYKDFSNINLNNNYLFNEKKINKNINNKIYNNEINTSNEDNKNDISKYNTNSFFKYNNDEKILRKNKYDFNTYYNTNTYNERKYTEKNNDRNSIKNNPIYLTSNSLYRTKNEGKNDYNKKTNNSSDNDNCDYGNEIKNNGKEVMDKTLAKNKSCYTTQTRFYRNKLEPLQFSSNYTKEKMKTSISNEKDHSNDYDLNECKNKNNKNLYNRNNISHSVSNSNCHILQNSNFYNEYLNNYNHNSNTYLKNSIYNEILQNNNLYNNNKNKNIDEYISNNINMNKSKSSKRLNIYKTSSILSKGNLYSNISKSNGINNNRNQDNQKLIKFLESYSRNEKGKNFSDRNYRIFSQTSKNNNGFSMNYLLSNEKDNKRKLCNKCIRKRMINKNGNDIIENSKLKLCSKCQKLNKFN